MLRSGPPCLVPNIHPKQTLTRCPSDVIFEMVAGYRTNQNVPSTIFSQSLCLYQIAFTSDAAPLSEPVRTPTDRYVALSSSSRNPFCESEVSWVPTKSGPTLMIWLATFPLRSPAQLLQRCPLSSGASDVRMLKLMTLTSSSCACAPAATSATPSAAIDARILLERPTEESTWKSRDSTCSCGGERVRE
jgi:hypothetical protein